MRVVSQYEVSCPRCKVSYPVGQKRCVHCGGPMAPSIVDVPDAPPQLRDGAGARTPAPMQPGEDERETVFLPFGREEDEGPSGGSALSRLGGLVWIVIFVIITVMRACFGE